MANNIQREAKVGKPKRKGGWQGGKKLEEEREKVVEWKEGGKKRRGREGEWREEEKTEGGRGGRKERENVA